MVLYSKSNIKNIVCNISIRNRCVQRKEEIDIVLPWSWKFEFYVIRCNYKSDKEYYFDPKP